MSGMPGAGLPRGRGAVSATYWMPVDWHLWPMIATEGIAPAGFRFTRTTRRSRIAHAVDVLIEDDDADPALDGAWVEASFGITPGGPVITSRRRL